MCNNATINSKLHMTKNLAVLSKQTEKLFHVTAVTYAKKVVMYQKGCTAKKLFLYNTNRKSHAAYQTALLLITSSDLQGNVSFATFFIHNSYSALTNDVMEITCWPLCLQCIKVCHMLHQLSVHLSVTHIQCENCVMDLTSFRNAGQCYTVSQELALFVYAKTSTLSIKLCLCNS